MISFLPFSENRQITIIAKRYAWTLPIIAVMGLVNGFLEGIGIGLLIPMLGSLLGSEPSSQHGLIGWIGQFGHQLDPHVRLYVIAGAMLGLVICKSALQSASRIFIVYIDGRAGHDIRRALAQRLLNADYAFHLAQDHARLLAIISTESWKASDAIRAAFTRAASLAAALMFFVFLFALNWWLTLIVVVGALVIRVGQKASESTLRRLSKRIAQSNRNLEERMLASVYHARIIRLFGRQSSEQSIFEDASDQVRRSMFRVDRLYSVVAPALEVAHIALFIGTLIIAFLAGVTLPVLATFLVLLNRLQPYLRAIETASIDLASASTQVAEVEWLLNAQSASDGRVERLRVDRLTNSIEFRHVTFAYPSRVGAAIENVSFVIRAGSTTAIAGRSGAGKSTLINLICGLVRPSSGAILVDGVDLASLDQPSWLNTIGVAGQDVDLVDGTIAENIAFGREDLTLGAIEAGARQADAHEFITALPDGYATTVGYRGHALSGGQRQRIGIARALARRPSLLILDEATNAVDGLSETAILNLLRLHSADLTIIIISHHLGTHELCEDKIELKMGGMVDPAHVHVVG